MPAWTDQVQSIASIAAVVVAIVGFFFISHQIGQMNRAGRGDAHGIIFAHYLEITKLMLDRPHLQPYFYEGKELSPGDPLYHQVLIVCEVFGDFYEHVAMQLENLPKNSRDCWNKAIAHRCLNNPALHAYMLKRKDVYASDIFEAIERGRILLRRPAHKANDRAGTPAPTETDPNA